MKATELVSSIAKFMTDDKDVFVHIYTRDELGCVISTQKLPLANAFAHEKGIVKLCTEDPNNPK